MKKLKKAFLVILMSVVLALPNFGGLYVAFAQDDLAKIGAQIVIMQIPTEGKIGTSLNIPKGSSPDGTVNTKIFDPRGAVVFDSSQDTLPDGSLANTYLYNPPMLGTYSVQYSVISPDEGVLASTYSQKYNIIVRGDRPVFDFNINSDILLPHTANYEQVITLPYPKVTNSLGEEVELSDVAQNINIVVKNPSGQAVTLDTVEIDEVDYKTFKTLEADGQGTYTIEYEYQELNGLTARRTFELQVDSSFSASKIKLNHILDGSMPATAVQGNNITLPKSITRNQNAGNVLLNTYIEVKVEYINPDGDNIVYELEDFKFRPLHKGDYKVTYKVYDFYSKLENKPLGEYTYTIKDVKDTQAPTVQPVENYAPAYIDDAEYTFVNAAYAIPSNVPVGATVYFPAIHAKDNLTNSSDLTLKRTIVNNNNTVTDLDHNTDNDYGKNEGVPYTFLTEGTFTVRYSATDLAGNERSVSHTLKVVDGFIDNEAPRITMPSIVNYVKPGETIKFLKPTAVDYVNTTSASTSDTRLKIEHYIYFDANDDHLIKILEDENDSNYLSFVIPNEITASLVTIQTRATDDGVNNSGQPNTAIKEHKINILDLQDTVAPSFAGSEPTITAKDQGTIVDIPVVKFSDNHPGFLSVTVIVRDPQGGNVKVTGVQLQYELDTLEPSDADGIKVIGGRFSAIFAGNYRITYTATDIAGNSYVKSYVQYINDTQAPSFQISSIPSNIEVGETFTLPIPKIIDNGVEIENQAITTIEFINSPSYSLVMASYQFTALEEGVYSFRYIAKDSSGNTSESAIYTMTATDTIKPVITLNEDITFPSTQPLTRASEEDPYDAIAIPDFTASDELNGIKEFSVVIKNPSGQTVLEAKNGEGALAGTYSFVPTRNGHYTVTYSATDFAGNTTTDIRGIQVGDNAQPIITIGNTAVNKPGNQKLNNTITLDLSSITITDETDGDISKNAITNTGERKFTVVLTGPNGATINQVVEGEYNYKLDQAGEYTLTYTARDEAGNIKVESTVFQVTAPTSNPLIVTETLGIILIVVSLLVLGGVVIYFVKSREIVKD